MTHGEFRTKYLELVKILNLGVMEETKITDANTPYMNDFQVGLRVGVQLALVETAALRMLLIEKGIITRDENDLSILSALEKEKVRLEKILSHVTNKEIKL